MQTVSVWISNVELARTPRSVTDLSPIEIGGSDRELFGEFIDVCDNESVRWSIALAEVLGLVPLKVKFHTVTPHAGVFRFDGCVPEGGLETKQLVELDGRCDVANHQYWLNRVELCHRVDPSLRSANCLPNTQYPELRYRISARARNDIEYRSQARTHNCMFEDEMKRPRQSRVGYLIAVTRA
jgi:hypothetical protein